MDKFIFDKSYHIGIEEIDLQHEYFIGLINSFYELSKNPSDKKKAEKITKELWDYAKKHFSTEEKYFEKYNYPYAEEHSIEHIKLLQKVNSLCYSFSLGQTSAKEIYDFLVDWLKNHLKTHDKKYADYFKKIGAIK